MESLNLTKVDKHAKVYENSSSLGSFVWSSDSKQIAYVAEEKKSGKENCFFTGTDKKEIDETNFEEVLFLLFLNTRVIVDDSETSFFM